VDQCHAFLKRAEDPFWSGYSLALLFPHRSSELSVCWKLLVVYNLFSFSHETWCSLPQGSTLGLGPIPLAMYLAPLEQVVFNSGARCHQYADLSIFIFIVLFLSEKNLSIYVIGKITHCQIRFKLYYSLHMLDPCKVFIFYSCLICFDLIWWHSSICILSWT